jgi:hypothetical protein
MIVPTKAGRLRMSVMGQAFFSARLLQRFRPRSVESVTRVGKDDDVVRPLFEQYLGMRVVECPAVVLGRRLR